MEATESEPAELRRMRQERDLYRRLLELGQGDDLQRFAEDSLAAIVATAGAQRGYLELDRGRFYCARGFERDELEAVRAQISTGIVSAALKSQQTVSTASALDDPRFASHRSVQAGRIAAVLCAPIDAGTPLGVVYLQGRTERGPFPEADRRLVELFARNLAPLADRLLSRQEAAGQTDHTAAFRSRLAVAGLAGTSAALAEAFRQLGVAAPVHVAVLLTGESGTGKTAFARALHDSSPRAQGPFVELNCAALPEALFESELFGAEKGAHSTATQRIEGKVDAAQGGTLFLDEVGEIPLPVQGKLLQFLQSKRYFRLGSTTAREAELRVVAATNRDLEEAVAARRFRDDLFYRLNVLQVRVPSLRERPEDLGPIADALLTKLGAQGAGSPALSRAARAALREAEWPGNVRQLENVLARGWATALSEHSATIEPKHLFPERAGPVNATIESPTFQEATRRFQAQLIEQALVCVDWNVSEAARRLDLSRSRLNELIRAFGLSRQASERREA